MGLPGGQIALQKAGVGLGKGSRHDEFQILAQGFLPGIAEHALRFLVETDDHVVFIDGDQGVGGAIDDPGVDLLLLAQFLKLAGQLLQEGGGGTGHQIGQAVRGKIGLAGDRPPAIQDEVEPVRLQLAYKMHLTVRRDIGPGAVQDDFHGRVAFQGEGQQLLLAEEILPFDDQGDADGSGR